MTDFTSVSPILSDREDLRVDLRVDVLEDPASYLRALLNSRARVSSASAASTSSEAASARAFSFS